MVELQAKNYLLENLEVLQEVVQEINLWDGSLENLEVYSNDEEFFETFFPNDPFRLIGAIQFGSYSINDDYVKFNGLANLESFDEYELKQELKDNIDEIIEQLINCFFQLDLNDELDEIFSEL